MNPNIVSLWKGKYESVKKEPQKLPNMFSIFKVESTNYKVFQIFDSKFGGWNFVQLGPTLNHWKFLEQFATKWNYVLNNNICNNGYGHLKG